MFLLFFKGYFDNFLIKSQKNNKNCKKQIKNRFIDDYKVYIMLPGLSLRKLIF